MTVPGGFTGSVWGETVAVVYLWFFATRLGSTFALWALEIEPGRSVKRSAAAWAVWAIVGGAVARWIGMV